MTPIEIRERVAREVFGLTRHDESYQSETRGDPVTGKMMTVRRFVWKNADGRTVYTGDVFLPHYESEIAAAFQVVEEMRSRCRRLRLIQTDNGAWFAEFVPVRLGQPYKTGVSDTVAATAISLAALAAMEASDA